MMFNDDFLEEEYTNLPHYDGTEMLPVRGDMHSSLNHGSALVWVNLGKNKTGGLFRYG